MPFSLRPSFSCLALLFGLSGSLALAPLAPSAQAKTTGKHAKSSAKSASRSASAATDTACHAPSDVHAAFNVAGLKSELMVTALSCQAQDRYNAFIEQFRPVLLKADARLESYFRTNYGRQGQKQRDDYTTQLADVQSLGGLKSGTVFCDQRLPMFDEVAILETTEDLSHYAEAKDVAQPTSYESCSAPKPLHKRAIRGRRHR